LRANRSLTDVYALRLELCRQLLQVTREFANSSLDEDVNSLMLRAKEREKVFRNLIEASKEIDALTPEPSASNPEELAEAGVKDLVEETKRILLKISQLDGKLIAEMELRRDKLAESLADNATKRQLTKSFKGYNAQVQPKFMDKRT